MTEAPQQHEAPALQATEPMIQILPHMQIPLSQVVAARDPNCRLCHEGLVTHVQANGERSKAVCGCAIARMRRKIEIAKNQASARSGEGESSAALASRILHQRQSIEMLERELQQAEEDLAERRRRFEEGAQSRLEQLHANEAASQQKRQEAQAVSREAEVKRERLIELRQEMRALEDEGNDLIFRAHSLIREAESIMQDLEPERQRLANDRAAFEASIAKPVALIEKLRRRLATKRAYNPGAVPIE